MAAARHVGEARFEAEPFHAVRKPARVAADVLAMLRQRADARDSQLFEKVCVRLLLTCFGQLQRLLQHLLTPCHSDLSGRS
jgi:hypothetical protein